MSKDKPQNEANQSSADAAAQAEQKRLADQEAERQLQAEIEAEEAEKKRAADAQAESDRKAADEAGKSQVDEQATVDKERETLEYRLEKLEAESVRREQEMAALQVKLAQKAGSKEPITLRGKAFNAEKSRDQIRKIWPRDSERIGQVLRMPMPTGKTFLVTPLGEAAGNMLPAIVSNCADEGDAKREYFATNGAVAHKIQVSVEPHGETKRQLEEQQRAFEELHGAAPDELAEFREYQAQKRAYQRRA